MPATFLLYGDIGESTGDMPTISANNISEFIENNKDADELVVRINSRGGSIQEGFLIHDLLKSSGKQITTIGEGKVFSIATVIFLAGDKRIMMEHADGLIHLPFIPPYTLADKYESDDLAKLSTRLKQEENKIVEFYHNRTGADPFKLRELMEKESMLSAADMVELGFATEIQEPLKAIAFFNTNQKSNVMSDELEKKFDGFFARVENLFSRQTEPKNMVITDAAGQEFTIEREEGDIAVGDKASPDGTYTLENGSVVTVANSEVASIAEPQAKEHEEDEEMKALKEENAQLKLKISEMESKNSELAANIENFQSKKDELNQLVTDLRNFKSEVTVEGRSNNFKNTEKKFDPAKTLERLTKLKEE